MKNAMKSILVVILVSNLLVLSASAQHLSVNLTNKGLRNLINSALQTAKNKQKIGDIVIKGGPVFDRIDVDSFNENSIIKSINEFVPLNQNEDFIFYFDWSPIYVKSHTVQDSLKVGIEGDKSNFKAHVKLSLDMLKISGESLEICELKNWKCDRKKNLFGQIKDYSISLKRNSQIDIAAVLGVKVVGDVVELKLENFISNLVQPKTRKDKALYQKYGITYNSAALDIHFDEFIIPPLLVSINGEVLEADLSGLRSAILDDKERLAGLLAGFAGDFAAKDLTSILNKEFFSSIKNLKTTFNVVDYRISNELSNSKSITSANYETISKNNKLVKVNALSLDQVGLDNKYNKSFYSSVYEEALAKRDNTYVASRQYKIPEKEISFIEKLQGLLGEIISRADYDITYKSTVSQKEKNITVNFDSEFSMNNIKWELGTSLRRGKAELKEPKFSAQGAKGYDVAIAISEPMLNAALKVASKKKLIQKIVTNVAGLKGVNIHDVHIHLEESKKHISYINDKLLDERYQREFIAVADNTRVPLYRRPVELEVPKTRQLKRIVTHTKDSLVVVAQVIVDFDELESDGIINWFSNQIGGMIEDGKIWFPVEIKFMPTITKVEGRTYLELLAFDPVNNLKFKNTYGYPYKKMSKIVEKGVIKIIKEELTPLLKDIPKVDLTSHLSFPGVEVDPVGLDVKESGHLVIKTNIKKLDLKKLSEGKKNE